MRQLKVRFLLLSGHYIDVLLPEASARKYVQDWGRSELKGKLDGIDGQGVSWAVDTDKIQGLHTYDPEEIRRVQEQALQQQQQMLQQQAVAQGATGGNKAWCTKTGSG